MSIPVAVRSPVCQDRWFESRWGAGFSSLVFDVCCVGISLCHELIIRSEESYRMCLCVCVCLIVSNPETSAVMRPRPYLDCSTTEKINYLANKFSPYECRVGAEHVCLWHPSYIVWSVWAIFEVLTVQLMKLQVLYDVTPCRLVHIYRSFWGPWGCGLPS